MSNRSSHTIKARPARVVPAFYRLNEAAAIAGCGELTLRRAILNGKLKALQPTGPGGHIIICQGNLAEFIAARKRK
jgi:hypothetical protein